MATKPDRCVRPCALGSLSCPHVLSDLSFQESSLLTGAGHHDRASRLPSPTPRGYLNTPAQAWRCRVSTFLAFMHFPEKEKKKTLSNSFIAILLAQQGVSYYSPPRVSGRTRVGFVFVLKAPMSSGLLASRWPAPGPWPPAPRVGRWEEAGGWSAGLEGRGHLRTGLPSSRPSLCSSPRRGGRQSAMGAWSSVQLRGHHGRPCPSLLPTRGRGNEAPETGNTRGRSC